MTMPDIANFAQCALLVWLALMAVLVVHRCLNGDIALAGILAHDEDHLSDGRPAAERVQLLAAFLFAVAAYGRGALHAMNGAHGVPLAQLPEASPGLVALFAGSHSIYLTGKFGRALKLGRFMAQ